MSDYELGLFIKKMFEPCEIRIDETERFETLEGKIISYSIPMSIIKILVMVIQILI